MSHVAATTGDGSGTAVNVLFINIPIIITADKMMIHQYHSRSRNLGVASGAGAGEVLTGDGEAAPRAQAIIEL
jgi:hypothetical protein